MEQEATIKFVSPIANPLAGEKLSKKLLSLASKLVEPKCLKRGVKECVKALRKGVKGICVMAADVNPVDTYSHIPIICEEQGVPYIFVPSQDELGDASLTNKPTAVVIMTEPEEQGLLQKYNALLEKVRSSNPFFP